ncbi:MAG: UvrD-helicase domain-containing protein, partial [Clostridia bacterium]|nr:UvrD-helicase domain-containing protein [Clostridia bacterium]
MEFTKVQQKAIDTKDCSLLVAAGAGSGKTRVLTERIIDRILDTDGNINITDFLIVTFTKAAAEEMRSRIRKALTERSRLYPENKKLIKNIALLPQARISTISSFCLDLIKENYQKLNLFASLRVAEEDETNVIIDRIITAITEERLTEPEKHPLFLTVYELFSGKKNDTPFAECIKKIYKKLTNLPSMEIYLNDICERYKEFSNADELFDTFFGKLIKEYTYSDLNTARELIVSALERSKLVPRTHTLLAPVLEKDIVAIDNILSSLHAGFDAAHYQISRFSPDRKPQDRNLETKDFTDSVWV